jgi:SecD/SecF fusion protein
MDIGDLRSLIEQNIGKRLVVQDAKPLDEEGRNFLITYQDGTQQKVRLAKKATPEEVRKRASELPDWSLEQIFVHSQSGGERTLYTVRTSEREQDLVQVTLDRVLSKESPNGWTSLLQKTDMKPPKILVPGKEAELAFENYASPNQVKLLIEREFQDLDITQKPELLTQDGTGDEQGRYKEMRLALSEPVAPAKFAEVLKRTREEFQARPLPERLENFDSQLAAETQLRAMYAILASWIAILLYLWFRFGNWTFGMAAVLCLVHDLFFTLGIIAFSHWLHDIPGLGRFLLLQDFKIDLPAVAALLTLVGYSVSDTIVVFDRIREVRGKNPELTPQMINDSVNQTLSRTLLTAFSVWLVVIVLYIWGGEGVHLFAFCMVVGVIVGTYSSIYIASPLLLMFGEGARRSPARERQKPGVAGVPA